MAQFLQKNYKPIDGTQSQEDQDYQKRLNKTYEASVILSSEKDLPTEVNSIEIEGERDRKNEPLNLDNTGVNLDDGGEKNWAQQQAQDAVDKLQDIKIHNNERNLRALDNPDISLKDQQNSWDHLQSNATYSKENKEWSVDTSDGKTKLEVRPGAEKVVENEREAPSLAQSETEKGETAELKEIKGEAETTKLNAENLNEQGHEQKEENETAENTGATTDYDAERRTNFDRNRQVELMGQVQSKFEARDAKYYHPGGQNKLAFKDKNSKVVTSSNEPSVATAMAQVIAAKGAKSMSVKGHKDFRREVWMEGSKLGMEVKGFKPTEKDLIAREARNGREMSNMAEKITPQNKEVKSDKLQMNEAIAVSYVKQNVPANKQEAVQQAINQKLGEQEKVGSLPSIPVYDHTAPQQDQHDKSQPIVEREAEHIR